MWYSPAGGERYWGNQHGRFVTRAKDFFNDNSTYFTNHDYELSSTAKERWRDGKKYAEGYYESLTKGMKKDEDVF